MLKITIAAGIGSLAGTLLIFPIKTKKIRILALCVYVLVIVYFTLFRQGGSDQRLIQLMPFHSYEKFYWPDIRWQIYMNVFLFIPLGFMLPWATDRTLLHTIFIGCLLSILIEASQYIFRIGMCETDDVIHNTLGTAIGFGYWKLVRLITERIKKHHYRKDSPIT